MKDKPELEILLYRLPRKILTMKAAEMRAPLQRWLARRTQIMGSKGCLLGHHQKLKEKYQEERRVKQEPAALKGTTIWVTTSET